MPDLKRRPSEIIKSEQLIVTCESEETGLDRVLQAAGTGTVCYASDYCHWDCNFPDSAKDIIEAGDLNFAQKKNILGLNAIDFFALKNLPEPRALKIARQSWETPGDRSVAYGGR
jgi:hypothetical protein